MSAHSILRQKVFVSGNVKFNPGLDKKCSLRGVGKLAKTDRLAKLSWVFWARGQTTVYSEE